MARSRASAQKAGSRCERMVADYLAAQIGDDRIDRRVWKPIPGWEGLYEVSDHGDVRSVDRYDNAGRRLSGKLLSQGLRPDGKRNVALCRDGRCKSHLVHRLVIIAFVGPAPDGTECCHRDDDGSNNQLVNLYWGSRSDNLHDSVRNRRHYQASLTHCKHGHEFTPANTARTRRGHRQCRACRVRQSRIQRARKRSAA